MLDLLDPVIALDLPALRSRLVRLEDTIIFLLIERAQFPRNDLVYASGGFDLPGCDKNISFLDWFLHEQEVVYAKGRRYLSPDQLPFTKNLPEPVLPPIKYPAILHPNSINENERIKEFYVNTILPELCKHLNINDAKDSYGSSAVTDIECLQALSTRIHFGKFVAEVKFQKETELMTKLIKARDSQGIYDAITNKAVEQQILERLYKKASTYGRDPSDSSSTQNSMAFPIVKPDVVVSLYKNFVIPLTKEVEVEYLLKRLD